MTFDVDCFIGHLQWNHDSHRCERQGRTGGLQWSALPVKKIFRFHDTLSNMSTIMTMVYEYHTDLDYFLTMMSALMLNYHLLQVCYPSLLVTPQHWSRVPHARSKDHFYIHHHNCITTTSPPQLHLGKGSVTPGTGVSLRRPTTLIQRALKSDPVSLT